MFDVLKNYFNIMSVDFIKVMVFLNPLILPKHLIFRNMSVGFIEALKFSRLCSFIYRRIEFCNETQS